MAIELLANEVTARFYTLLWPMTRISALVLSAPILSQGSITLRLRISLIVVLTWLIWPMHDWPVLDPVSATGLLYLLQEVFIGILMGLILQIVVGAFVVGGQAISATLGLSMANMVDPNMGSVPIIGQVLIVMGTLIFVGLGGHTMTIGLVLESFRTIPVATTYDIVLAVRALLEWSSMLFIGGVLLALPVLVTLLFINIGLGVVTRAAPSLNIFAVGFPAMLIVGLVVLWIALGSMGERLQWLWVRGLSEVQSVLGVI